MISMTYRESPAQEEGVSCRWLQREKERVQKKEIIGSYS
jgi:hypothetical protein